MKNKSGQVALYDPYLDILGGGEKHILSIIEVFAEQGFEVNIFWDKNLSKEIKDRFAFRYIDPAYRKAGTSKWLPNIFKGFSPLRTLRTLRAFDYFFYVTDGSYFFSSAKKNFIFCMVPDKKLYNLNFLNRLKLWNYKFISNSSYTTKWLTKWGISPITITPYIDDKLFTDNQNKKEKIILSVGRFFSHLHSKNQEKIIETFKLLKLSNPQFKDYGLILAGGLKKEDQSYFNGLKELAGNDPSIIFKPNVKLYELYKLYELATYFWHFTGLGVDEEKHPEQVEHFGIAPLEAIASGCLTFCHASGGPKQIIVEGENGFLFSTVDELILKMLAVSQNESLRKKVFEKGRLFVKKRFSYKVFKSNVLKLTV
jgi:glycosyltransferase involved in cell wall biosynthesis